MEVLHDISAWDYFRAPASLRDAPITPEDAARLVAVDRRLLSHRINASRAMQKVQDRLFCDLKGLSLPLHLMTDGPTRGKPTGILDVTRMRQLIDRTDLIGIGNGLYVTFPALTLALMAKRLDAVELALLMNEGCGLYALPAGGPLLNAVIREMVYRGELTAASVLDGNDGVREFLDEHGKRVSFVDAHGDDLGWTPCFESSGAFGDLWKRPPLVTRDELELYLEVHRPFPLWRTFARALTMCFEGTASPLETRAVMLMCAPPREGGEGWNVPEINRRINLDERAQRLSGRTYVVADALWTDPKCVCEVNGFSYHADRDGYREHEGRIAALESMGYTVVTLEADQLGDLGKLESRLEILAERAGLALHSRSAAFLERRRELHDRLFGRAQ